MSSRKKSRGGAVRSGRRPAPQPAGGDGHPAGRQGVTGLGRTPRDSAVEMREIVLPSDANVLGAVLGGKVMHLMDLAAAMAAHRHARRPAVTAMVDELTFLHPIHIGEHMILRASVNRAFTTSMEVGVKVFAENPWTGEGRHTSSAYFTFVTLGEDGRPALVPAIVPETEEEQRRWREAGARRERRLAHRGDAVR